MRPLSWLLSVSIAVGPFPASAALNGPSARGAAFKGQVFSMPSSGTGRLAAGFAGWLSNTSVGRQVLKEHPQLQAFAEFGSRINTAAAAVGPIAPELAPIARELESIIKAGDDPKAYQAAVKAASAVSAAIDKARPAAQKAVDQPLQLFLHGLYGGTISDYRNLGSLADTLMGASIYEPGYAEAAEKVRIAQEAIFTALPESLKAGLDNEAGTVSLDVDPLVEATGSAALLSPGFAGARWEPVKELPFVIDREQAILASETVLKHIGATSYSQALRKYALVGGGLGMFSRPQRLQAARDAKTGEVIGYRFETAIMKRSHYSLLGPFRGRAAHKIILSFDPDGWLSGVSVDGQVLRAKPKAVPAVANASPADALSSNKVRTAETMLKEHLGVYRKDWEIKTIGWREVSPAGAPHKTADVIEAARRSIGQINAFGAKQLSRYELYSDPSYHVKNGFAVQQAVDQEGRVLGYRYQVAMIHPSMKELLGPLHRAVVHELDLFYAEDGRVLATYINNHPMTYDPVDPPVSRWKQFAADLVHLPSKLKRIYRYFKRVKALVASDAPIREKEAELAKLVEEHDDAVRTGKTDRAQHLAERKAKLEKTINQMKADYIGIPDSELEWSLYRLQALQGQEGILKSKNQKLVNNLGWRGAYNIQRTPSSTEFTESSVNEPTLVFFFKQAMDREQPTLSYQYTAAMNLHNFWPLGAHFMGATMQEMIIAAALTGKTPVRAIWPNEEDRHGLIMQEVYNGSRSTRRPMLKQQGIAPSHPIPGEYSARSMLANRAFAEIGAATAYLALRGNANHGGLADKGLTGIYKDEVFHYVVMNAGMKWGYGYHNRFYRLWRIYKHSKDNNLPQAEDEEVHDSGFPSLLAGLEYLIAFLMVDKRVDEYLRSVGDKTGRDLIGPFYKTADEAMEAMGRREHMWTDYFRLEKNPHLSRRDVEILAKRYPGRVKLEQRKIAAKDIRKIFAAYRDNLKNPNYWMTNRQDFKRIEESDGSTALVKLISPKDSPAIRLYLRFPKEGTTPALTVSKSGQPAALFESDFDAMTMRQLGIIMQEEGADIADHLKKAAADPSYEELMRLLNADEEYQKEPIRVSYDDADSIDTPGSEAHVVTPAGETSKPEKVSKAKWLTFWTAAAPGLIIPLWMGAVAFSGTALLKVVVAATAINAASTFVGAAMAYKLRAARPRLGRLTLTKGLIASAVLSAAAAAVFPAYPVAAAVLAAASGLTAGAAAGHRLIEADPTIGPVMAGAISMMSSIVIGLPSATFGPAAAAFLRSVLF